VPKPETIYCIDTISLLEGWDRYYPHDLFLGLWARLGALVEAGRLIAPDEVRFELEKKSDGAIKWAKQQKGLFVPIDDGASSKNNSIFHEQAISLGRFGALTLVFPE